MTSSNDHCDLDHTPINRISRFCFGEFALRFSLEHGKGSLARDLVVSSWRSVYWRLGPGRAERCVGFMWFVTV